MIRGQTVHVLIAVLVLPTILNVGGCLSSSIIPPPAIINVQRLKKKKRSHGYELKCSYWPVLEEGKGQMSLSATTSETN